MSINEQKILIVDDDHVVLKSLKDLLAIRGFNTEVAIGGQEAICQLDQNDYDLVLLDLHMPYVNGHDVMAHIRNKQINTSVIIVSGETSFEAAKNACSQGAYDFLRKPYATDELIITINNALKEKRLQKQLMQSERLIAIGQVFTGIQHSMKNMLNACKGGAYMVKTGLAKDNHAMLVEGWDIVQEGISRMTTKALAPIFTLFPTVIGPRRIAPVPTKTLFPRVGCRLSSCLPVPPRVTL